MEIIHDNTTLVYTQPHFIPLAPAEVGDDLLVVVKGYLTQRGTIEADNARWVSHLRKAGWRGSIAQLRWESGHGGELIQKIGMTLLLRVGARYMKKKLFLPLPPLFIHEVRQLHRHWQDIRRRADSVDTVAALNLIRAACPEGRVTLVGHSLGAKVVLNLLNTAAIRNYHFNDVALLAAAHSRRDPELVRLAESLWGRMVNVHHPNDWVLKVLYKVGEFTRFSPCGLKPVTFQHARIANVSAEQWLRASFRSHVLYPEVLPQTVGRELWGYAGPAEQPIDDTPDELVGLPAPELIE